MILHIRQTKNINWKITFKTGQRRSNAHLINWPHFQIKIWLMKDKVVFVVLFAHLCGKTYESCITQWWRHWNERGSGHELSNNIAAYQCLVEPLSGQTSLVPVIEIVSREGRWRIFSYVRIPISCKGSRAKGAHMQGGHRARLFLITVRWCGEKLLKAR